MKGEITLNESVKEAIEMALIKLLEKKDINKITVTELTEAAGVGRSSFYRNFNDFESVAVSYINRIYREYFEEKPADRKSYSKKYFDAFLKERFRFVKEHKEVFNVLHKNGILYSVLMKMDPEIRKQYLIADIDESRYFNAMIMSFSAGVIDEWVAGGMKEKPEELSEITKQCLSGIFKRLKDTF